MISEEKEDPILAAPSSTNEEKDEKIPLTLDQRRAQLLVNPNYGVILCFLEKFRSFFQLEEYSFHLIEENLLSDQENINRQFIDFHFALLKRISLGKGAKREKFLSIITKFASRFNYDDGEYLKVNGYARADIDLKIRILKNLLESQFDHNPPFKSSLLEKPSFEVRSEPFGRDRSGAFYWLFSDKECFIRLFRENVDEDRLWSPIAKDKDELEKFLQMLITDQLVRKKFPEWKFVHEPFNSLLPSTEFQERYAPIPQAIKKEETPPSIEKDKVKEEIPSDSESKDSTEKNVDRSRQASSTESHPRRSSEEEKPEINNNHEDKKLQKKKGRGRRRSNHRKSKKQRIPSNPSETPTTKGKKRKKSLSDHEEVKNEVVPVVEETQNPLIDEESMNNDHLPIALRRSRRIRKVPTTELPSIPTTPVKTPNAKKTTKTKGKTKPKKTTKSKGKRKRKRLGSSDDEGENDPASEEEEEEYNSDDYLPSPKQLDELNEEDLREEDEDEEYVPRRSAKTVAKRSGNASENTVGSSACCICSKTDRPEALLLCDDCDDPYHLECLKPPLIAVPDGDWFCPLCEHKRFAEKLIERFLQLIKEYQELELKKSQCISKRSNRLANVMLNLDKMVKKKRKNGIVDSDEEEEEAEEEEEEEEEDKDSVYGYNDDEDESFERAPKSKRITRYEPARKVEAAEELGVRSCRRRPQNYRFDEYDKKMKEAMIEAGVSGDDIDRDSDESDDNTGTPTKKRAGYEKDEDFDEPTNKNDDEFAPDIDRSDESDSEEDDDVEFDDDESSDGAWKNKRRKSSKKKLPTRSTRRRLKIRSEDDDESLSESELNDLPTSKSKKETDIDLSDEPRRSTRTSTAPKNYAKDGQTDDDEEDSEASRPPPRRMRRRKRLGSDDSFLGDDDYERIARKRDLVQYNKTLGPRSSISDHIKKLVEQESAESKQSEATTSQDGMKDSADSSSHPMEKPPSDNDDDFPTEEEFFEPKRLFTMRNSFNGPPLMSINRPAFNPTHSYQHAIVDPTARFAMIRPTATAPAVVRAPTSNGYPSNGSIS